MYKALLTCFFNFWQVLDSSAVSPKQGKEVASTVGAYSYVEVSSLSADGVDDLITEIVEAAKANWEIKCAQKKKCPSCVIVWDYSEIDFPGAIFKFDDHVPWYCTLVTLIAVVICLFKRDGVKLSGDIIIYFKYDDLMTYNYNRETNVIKHSSMSSQSHIHRAILWHCVKRHVFIHVHVSCQYMITTLSHFRDHVIAKDAFYESASFVNVDFEVCFTTQWYVCKKCCWYFMMIFFF